MVVLLYSGSAVTARKTSFLYLTHAPALILGASFSTLPASTPGRKFAISSVVQGHVSGVAGLQVPFAPTPSCRAAWMVSPGGCKGVITGFYSVFSTHCWKSSLEIPDLLTQNLPGSPMAV